MYQGRSFRAGRSLRRRHESEEDNIQLDVEHGVSGVLRELVVVLARKDGVPKSKRLSYLNAAVRAVSRLCAAPTKTIQSPSSSFREAPTPTTEITIAATQDSSLSSAKDTSLNFGEGEDDNRELYFCLLRCCLVHESKEVRSGGMRLLRYLIVSPQDVQALISVNTLPLIIRSLDIMLDNQIERVQALRLVRRMLHVAPNLFPSSLAHCLMAIARDGAKERDRLLRSALAVLNELAVLNTEVFVSCGGVSVLLHNILDTSLPRINEALLGALLFLLNTPKWRSHCMQLHQILAPFSDFHYKHTSYDLEFYSKCEERELRTEAGRLAVLVSLRSWPGLVALCQPDTGALKSFVALLYPNHEETRKNVIELLYELFRVPMGPLIGDYEEALSEHQSATIVADTDQFRLHEGFVAAEAKILLPHIAKYRPNLIQNHLSLVLYTLMCVDLFPALCEVIVSSSAQVSIRTTMLLGELLHQANHNLPGECGWLSHSLPHLLEGAAGRHSEEENTRRHRATQAITALLSLARTRLNHQPRIHSLYLSNIIRNSPAARHKNPKVLQPSQINSKLSKWLSNDHDDVIMGSLRDSQVLTSTVQDHHMWNWQLIIPVLRWPSENLQKLEDSNYRLFTKRLTHFFKPSSGLFSNVEISDKKCQLMAQALLLFVDFLLTTTEDDKNKYLEELLVDMSQQLNIVNCERPPHDAMLSPSHLNTTASQYYFLVLGRLSSSKTGDDQLTRAQILQQLLELVSISVSDIYAKLVSSCLHYSIDGVNRTILSKILTGCSESARMYGTSLLRALLRVEAEGFQRWGVELLVGQLYDESRSVSLAALDVLDEATDNEEYLEAVLRAPPSVLHLGDRGQLLLAKLVSSPRGFQIYHEQNFIKTLLDKWASTYCFKYVKLMETAIADSMTQHQRGEDGTYGRRTGSKHVVHDVFLLPHLHGSLTQHKEGFTALMQHGSVQNLVQIVKNGICGSLEEIFQLKASIWSMGHIGLSSDGVGFLCCEGVLPTLTQLASCCPVYSVRGTCFNALCLIATTKEGANLLRKYGWESVRRDHQERWQFVEEFVDPTAASPRILGPNQDNYLSPRGVNMSESDMDDPEISKCGFYFGDDSDGEEGGSDASFLVEGIGLDQIYPTPPTKSQTLPHKTKPPNFMGHQRSLSDCAPVPEEQQQQLATPATAPVQTSATDWVNVMRGSFRFKKKLFSSMRKKSGSSSRRESTSSRVSNTSTTSERMASLFQTARRLRSNSRSHSLTDPDEEEPPDGGGVEEKVLSSSSLSEPHAAETNGHSSYASQLTATDSKDDGLNISTGSATQLTPNMQINSQVWSGLSPIASGGSLTTLGSAVGVGERGVMELRGGRTGLGGGSVRGSSGALFAEGMPATQVSGTSTPVPGNSAPAQGLLLSTHSYYTLRSISYRHRVVSEPTADEKISRNSLRGFLSSSYDHSPLPYMVPGLGLIENRSMIRSPSGCSEVSSVRSFGGGRGSSNLAALRLGHGNPAVGYPTSDSGQCYLGFALPLDLDLVLYDASQDKQIPKTEGSTSTSCNGHSNNGAKDRLDQIAESEMETVVEELDSKKDVKNNLVDTVIGNNSVDEGLVSGVDSNSGEATPPGEPPKDEKNGLQLHTTDNCLACFSLRITLHSTSFSHTNCMDGVDMSVCEVIVESPPLQRVRAQTTDTGSSSQASLSSSLNSQEDDSGEEKKNRKSSEVLNRTLIRKEVIRFVSNLINLTRLTKPAESGLLALKQRWPKAFRDPCLYSEVCHIMGSYSYRLTARRFLQELFMDVTLTEIYEEAGRLLECGFTHVCESVNNKVVSSNGGRVPATTDTHSDLLLQPAPMADIVELTNSDKSDREEDC